MYRQGDVLIKEVNEIPKGLKKVEPENGHFILAEGEATGHFHGVPAGPKINMFKEDGSGGGLFLALGKDSEVRHQEHETVKLPKGLYEITRQRDYEFGRSRMVMD